MALSADLGYQTMGPVVKIPILLTVSTTYYKGGLMNYTAAGLGIKAADTVGYTFAGILVRGIVVGAAALVGEVEVGIVRVAFSGAAQTDVGEVFYATADDTVAKAATNAGAMGLCIYFETGYVWIDMLRTRPLV